MRQAYLKIETPEPLSGGFTPSVGTQVTVVDCETGEPVAGLSHIRSIEITIAVDEIVSARIETYGLVFKTTTRAVWGNKYLMTILGPWARFKMHVARFIRRFRRYQWGVE